MARQMEPFPFISRPPGKDKGQAKLGRELKASYRCEGATLAAHQRPIGWLK